MSLGRLDNVLLMQKVFDFLFCLPMLKPITGVRYDNYAMIPVKIEYNTVLLGRQYHCHALYQPVIKKRSTMLLLTPTPMIINILKRQKERKRESRKYKEMETPVYQVCSRGVEGGG
jgi:hypothetical protein